MELLLEGISELLKVNEKKIVITRKKLLSLAMHGFKGNKTICLPTIEHVKIKKATYLLSGYIQLTIKADGKQTQDTIKFKASENDAAEQIAYFIEQTNAGKKFRRKIHFDATDELLKYKQLLQAEIITPAEFEQLELLISKIEASINS